MKVIRHFANKDDNQSGGPREHGASGSEIARVDEHAEAAGIGYPLSRLDLTGSSLVVCMVVGGGELPRALWSSLQSFIIILLPFRIIGLCLLPVSN